MNRLKNKKIIVLLGSHRSGTSLAARIINQLGLPMGSDLIPGHIDNPEGFWEHRGILAETKAIEEKLDISPFKGSHLIPDDKSLLGNNRLTTHEKNLRKILKNELQNNKIFGFKDPRTLLLLPLWQKIIYDEGLEPVYVILMRHPSAVAQSIAGRQGLTVDHGEFIWCCHWAYAISNLDRPPDVILNYEDWFTSPDKQCRWMMQEKLLNQSSNLDSVITVKIWIQIRCLT